MRQNPSYQQLRRTVEPVETEGTAMETNAPIVKREESVSLALTPADVRQQVNQIQELMQAVMQRDQHYGVIPGCGNKPTLLQPGAQKLAMMFRLSPAYDIQRVDLANDHREYTVRCTLTHMPSGAKAGEGVGICSTREKKYAQRKDGTANPNLADTYNTVVKMGCKRAMVAAVLTATAASDCFTQDIEDMPDLAAPAGSTAPVPAARKVENKAAPTASPTNAIVGKVKALTGEKSGTSKAGKPWTMWMWVMEDGLKCTTFSSTVKDAIERALAARAAVSLVGSQNQYGLTVESVAAPESEQQQTPDDAPPQAARRPAQEAEYVPIDESDIPF